MATTTVATGTTTTTAGFCSTGMSATTANGKDRKNSVGIIALAMATRRVIRLVLTACMDFKKCTTITTTVFVIWHG